MKRILLSVCAAVAFVTVAMGAASDPLSAGFADPPRAAAPHVWWHWMNGNVSKEGITADLEAMAAAGIAGAQAFDVGCSIPAGPVAFGTNAWFDMLVWAHKEAKRLGLELCFANCSGFSSSGGPWVKPEDGMKEVVFTETVVPGGRTFRGRLPQPESKHGFYADIATLAVPAPAGASYPLLLPGARAERTEKDGTVTYLFTFPEPCAAKDVRFTITGPADFAWKRIGACALRLEASADGAAFRTVLDEPSHAFHTGGGAELLPRTLHFPETRARAFRFTVALREGAAKRLTVSAAEVGAFPRVPGLAVYQRGSINSPARGLREPLAPADAAVSRAGTVDLTDRVAADGTLEWDAPKGTWVLLRIGYAANGRRNHPASDKGVGLEVDKLSAAAVGRCFDGYIGKVAKMCGIDPSSDPRGRAGFNNTLVDSYEVGGQNWTQGFEREFAARAGYDIRPYLPAFAGYLVDDADTTERFFTDFRRVVSALFVENYADEMARLCRKAGILFSCECYGNFVTDEVRWGWNVDLPMGEFWAVNPDIERREAPQDWMAPPADGLDGARFMRPWVSVAHMRGLRYFGSEAFTSFPADGRWQQDPWSYKQTGDAAYCGGVNRMIYHRWAHQPWTKPPRLPGMTMGVWGTHFERTETWWPMVGPWIKYQTRCQHLLQEGLFAPDVLFYSGEEIPNNGRGKNSLLEPGMNPTGLIPRCWLVDSASRDILPFLTAKNGRVYAPSGISYGAVVMQPRTLASPEALRTFADWAAKGVRIAGVKPKDAPGLAGGAAARAEARRLADEIWSRPNVTALAPGEAPTRALLEGMGLRPSFLSTPGLNWYRRAYADGTDGFFVCSPATTATVARCSFAVTGRVPELWNAETGEMFRAREWKEADGRTEVTVPFAGRGSWFVMFRPAPTAGIAPLPAPRTLDERQVAGPWHVTFPTGWYAGKDDAKRVTMSALTDWTTLADPDLKYFSGIVTYETTFTAPPRPAGSRVKLDLGKVKNLAEVTVNGRTWPALWRPPFALDVTDALRDGDAVQTLRVRVANLWVNRLIGDEELPRDVEWLEEAKPMSNVIWGEALAAIPEFVRAGKPSPTGRHTFTTWHHWRKGEKLLSSGLLGPVRLVVETAEPDREADWTAALREPVLSNGAGNSTWQYVFTELAAKDAAADRAWRRLKTRAEYDAHCAKMRAAFLDGIGGLPAVRSPLNARVTGTVKREGYRVEKVLFESYPGVHVTANLFVPDGASAADPRPAVVVTCGHSSNGKAYAGYQRGCVQLAKAGFVALIYDPFNQGERGPQSTVMGHTSIGVKASLLGWSMARLRIWDGMRAIDYVQSRPEVRKDAIGYTGQSGGGTMSALMTAIDGRVRAGAPSCYLTSLREVCEHIGPQDAEQNLFGQLSRGLNHAGYVLMRGVPVQMNVCRGDFFPYSGSVETFGTVQDVAAMLGAEERYSLFDVPGGHGWREAARTSMVAWMRRWVAGERSVKFEPEAWRALDVDFDPAKSDMGLGEKECFAAPEGDVKNLPGERSAYDLLREELAAVERTRPPLDAAGLAAAAKRLAGIRTPKESGVFVRTLGVSVRAGGVKAERLAFAYPDGFAVPAVLLVPPAAKGAPVVVAASAGRDACGKLVAEFLDAGRPVLAADVSGTGEISGLPIKSYYGSRFKEEPAAVMLYLLGESMVGRRAGEMLALADYAKTRFGAAPLLVTSGVTAPVAAAHAFAAGRDVIAGVRIEGDAPLSWTEVVRGSSRHKDGAVGFPFASCVTGALRVYDWPDLLK